MIYAVIKVFDTLAEADRFAEQVTEDDIVAVFPLDALDEEPAKQGRPADRPPPAGSSSSGPGDLGTGLPASLTAGESNRPAPNVIPFRPSGNGWSVKV